MNIISSNQNFLLYLIINSPYSQIGTFKSCTKHFLQMFTIHGFRNGHYIPLVFFLLPDKRFSTYRDCFIHLQQQSNNVGNFYPKRIFADFEETIHNAARSVWSDAAIKGCRFHLGQSW